MEYSRRRARTRAALLARALELFEAQGYEQTSAAEIAAAAGVREMTFFRHFPSKDRVLLDDPYDAELVAAVAARPAGEAPLARTVNGLRSAWAAVPEPAVEVVRRRARIVASTPALRAAVARNNLRTEDAGRPAGRRRLRPARGAVGGIGGAGRLDVGAAVVGGGGQADLSSAIERALAVFDPDTTSVSR